LNSDTWEVKVMRILLIGCVKSSEFFLKQLIFHGYTPVGVITKRESSFNTDFVDLSPICKASRIPFIQIVDINTKQSTDFVKECAPDVIYCFGWSQLLQVPILRIPPLGVVGFHPAKLPQNRGRHPLIWALALGLMETASTFFMLDEHADTGGIISQKIVPISYEDDAATLYTKILQVAGKQMLSFTRDFDLGAVTVTPQMERGNSWRKRGIQDGKIDWRMSSRAIYNLVRALTKPYPGAHFCKDGALVKVWKVKEACGDYLENIECGKVLSIESDTEFHVKTYDSVIHVVSCEPVLLKEGEYLL